jgi:hypothetical protein
MQIIDAALGRLITPTNYQATRQHVFPSQTSLQWFVRSHRQRLVKTGALVTIAGRNLIDEQEFDSEVIAIGRETAQAA